MVFASPSLILVRVMEPAEAGDWLYSRPKQLVFLTGLDPINKKSHKSLATALEQTSGTSASLPLKFRLVSGELDLPGKRALALDKGKVFIYYQHYY